MSSKLRVTLVQVGYGDAETLVDRVERVATQVEALPDTDIVVLPELWAHGGFASASWAEQAESLGGPTASRLAEVARQRGFWLHGGSIIERATDGAARGHEGRGLWNTSLLFDPDGRLHDTYRKIHRFGFGEGEPKVIEAGDRHSAVGVSVNSVPVTLGLATCYDLRFPELFRCLSDHGAEVVIVPAAWPLARVDHWRLLGRARAVENQTWVLQCNTAGTHSGLTMGGRSQVVAPTGDVIGALGTAAGVLTVDIDLSLVEKTRQEFPVLRDRRLRGGGLQWWAGAHAPGLTG